MGQPGNKRYQNQEKEQSLLVKFQRVDCPGQKEKRQQKHQKINWYFGDFPKNFSVF